MVGHRNSKGARREETMREILVDGYNLIGAQGRFRRDREILLGERNRLKKALSVYASALPEPARTTVVFDGFPTELEGSHGSAGSVVVLFSEEEGTADAVIVRLALRHREQAIVISSDREVIEQSRSAGARVVGCREFLDRMAGRTNSQPSPRQPFIHDESDRDDYPQRPSKKGNPRKPSKKERQSRRTLSGL